MKIRNLRLVRDADIGQMVTKTSTVNGIDFVMSREVAASGKINTITYPSGMVVDYSDRDQQNRLVSLAATFNGSTTAFFSNME